MLFMSLHHFTERRGQYQLPKPVGRRIVSTPVIKHIENRKSNSP